MASRTAASTVEMSTAVKTIIIDDKEYSAEGLSDSAKASLNGVNYATAQILQKNNELQVMDTARISYVNALKKEIQQNG